MVIKMRVSELMIENGAREISAGNQVALVGSSERALRPLKRLLTSLGYCVECYWSETSFIESTSRQPTDVIIVESEIGSFTDIKLIKTLNERGIKTPIILLINDGNVVSAVEALKYGAADYLEKPIGDGALIKVLRQVCATPNNKINYY